MLQSGIIELDVHSMNRAQAKTYIDSQLKRAKKDIYQIKVIHGYRGGTAIRDMVRKTYRNHPKVVRVELPLNPGETNLISVTSERGLNVSFRANIQPASD